MKKSWILRLMSFWPPYLGAGIRVLRISPDFRSIDVEMKLRFWNQNYVGTHFGGSLFAMTDPFYMLMLIHNLGSAYTVWDKSASIRFKRPGRGKVTAQFRLNQAQIEQIQHQADRNGRSEPNFLVQIKDEHGIVVAEVEKVISVKKKLSNPS